MSVRRVPIAPIAPIAPTAGAVAPEISHVDRLRFSQSFLSIPVVSTGVSTRAGVKRQFILDNLPSKQVLLEGVSGMKHLMQYSRKMSEIDGKYIHDWEWNGDGVSNLFASFNFLMSNERFFESMAAEYARDVMTLPMPKLTPDQLALLDAFLSVLRAISAMNKFREAVPNYLQDREFLGEFSPWPSQ